MRKFFVTIAIIITHNVCFAQSTPQLQLLSEAEFTLNEGDTTLAKTQFREVLSKYPQNYVAIVRLAEINYEQAIYNQSTQYIYLGIDKLEELIDSQEPTFIQKKKNPTIDRLERYNSDLASLYHLLGLNRDKQLRRSEAIDAFQKSLSIVEHDEVMINLALTYASNLEFENAISVLHHAIAIDSSNFKSYYNLANLFNQSRDYDSAAFYYNQTVAINKEYKWPYLYLGRLHTQNQNFKLAIDSFTKFIALDSSLTEPFFRRATLYTNQGKFELALSDWNQVLLKDYGNYDAYRNRGLTYFYLEAYEKAIDDFNKALEINANEPNTLINRGYSYYMSNQSKLALIDLNKGIEMLPKYPLGFYIRALVLYQLNKKNKACTDLKNALELGLNEKTVDSRLIRKCL